MVLISVMMLVVKKGMCGLNFLSRLLMMGLMMKLMLKVVLIMLNFVVWFLVGVMLVM